MDKKIIISLILAFSIIFTGCDSIADSSLSANDSASQEKSVAVSESKTELTLAEVPDFSKNAYAVINGNEPFFTEGEKQNLKAFEDYADLDKLGRCGRAYANICKETMPTEKREDISEVHPSGWQKNKGWERCHLIGFQLSAENANKKNLITGTGYLNRTGMLPFENMIADYVKETNNHVLYRVTPFFEGDNLVASGVEMEAWSVEDSGDGICFNVYCYNVEPNGTINYTNGDVSKNAAATVTTTSKKCVYWSESGSVYHKRRDCSGLANAKNIYSGSIAESNKERGCKRCYD